MSFKDTIEETDINMELSETGEEERVIFNKNLNSHERQQLLELFSTEILIYGADTYGGFKKLVYKDNPAIQAGCICPLCFKVYQIDTKKTERP